MVKRNEIFGGNQIEGISKSSKLQKLKDVVINLMFGSLFVKALRLKS